VARLNPRLAAGVGVLSVFLLLGGSGAAVAIADEGGEHSGRGNGSGESGENGDWRGGSRGESHDRDSSNSEFRRGDGSGLEKQGGRPEVRVGSGREDTQQLLPSDDVDPRDGSGSSGGTGSSGGSGSAHTGASDSGFNPPRVTVGNGRSPGILSGGDREPRWYNPSSEPAPAPPPPPPPPAAPTAPSLIDRISNPPALPKQLSVAPAADWSDPLWGIAGLLLIPAAGAALGYRQARAAHAAERLGRP
jgi:hypothetical protein